MLREKVWLLSPPFLLLVILITLTDGEKSCCVSANDWVW
jgi:hypothetical protein